MSEHKFELKKDQPYIPLNKLLQLLQIAQTGGHAKIMIQNEEVSVNGTIETRVRKKIVKSDIITIGKEIIYVE